MVRGGSNVACVNLLCQISIVHVVCCGCFFKRNVDVIWRTKLLLQKLSQNLSRCTDVARWADRFEKIPICQISTATSGPDSPRPPTEISLVGGCEFIVRIQFRASAREVVRVLRKGCQISWLFVSVWVEIFSKWFLGKLSEKQYFFHGHQKSPFLLTSCCCSVTKWLDSGRAEA